MVKSREGITGNGVISSIFRSDSAVAVAVETCHGLLGEEGEGFFEHCTHIQSQQLISYHLKQRRRGSA